MSSSFLSHFLAVRDGKRLPRFVETRALPGPPGFSTLLDWKIALADRAFDSCTLCPHECRVNRNAGETGFCGVADKTAVHWEGVLHGEEIELVPSHEMFVSGCTMRCAFCYSHAHIVRPMSGRVMTPLQMARCVEDRRSEGAANWNIVGGEPTVHIPNILRALRAMDAPVPVVWNSNMYATPEAIDLLDGVVDLFLGDIHFGNPDCAQRLGRIPHYLPAVQAAFETAAASEASVIIRHLVMPGHVECCARPALEWAVRALPAVPFHLMFQYVPDFRAARDPILGRRVTDEEREQATRIANALGVNLYDDTRGAKDGKHGGKEVFDKAKDHENFVRDSVDILVHGDGRVSFTRLSGALMPVAAALSDADARLTRRGAKE